MKTILAALIGLTIAGSAYASEANHNGQMVRDTKSQSADMTASSFGGSLGQTTFSKVDVNSPEHGAQNGK